jgi:hypothetical protein
VLGAGIDEVGIHLLVSVMANEAHSRLSRCIRTREIGVRIVQAAHQAGVRRLAMEALPWPASDLPGPIRDIPAGAQGYLAQLDMRRLMSAALELGWSLWAYEASVEPSKDPAEQLTLEFTNWREREQAKNLGQLLAAAPGDPLLVWCGNGHARKQAVGEWVPMGFHFAATSAVQQFCDRPDGDRRLHRRGAPAVGTRAAGRDR